MGHTFNLSFSKYLKLGSDWLDAYSFTADLRKYFRISSSTLLAFQFRGYASWGKNPLIYWSGGNNTIRSANWRSLAGDRGFHFNAEFRFPLVNKMSTVLGNFGPIRGTLFFDLGGFWFSDDPDYRFFEEGKIKLQDGISSYGFGIQFFLFGVPLHFEWVYNWDFAKKEDFKFNFWIGLDF
jgi:outer membrane protein assembly factor BamA